MCEDRRGYPPVGGYTAQMPRLLIGPLLRYVGRTEATVWVETDEPCEVEILGAREHTWLVGGHHYAPPVLPGPEPGGAPGAGGPTPPRPLGAARGGAGTPPAVPGAAGGGAGMAAAVERPATVGDPHPGRPPSPARRVRLLPVRPRRGQAERRTLRR